MGVKIVLSHSHCTIESYRLLIIHSPHPPSVSSLAVRWSGLMLRRSCCLMVVVRMREAETFLLLLRPDR